MEDKKKNETRQSTMQNRMENMNGQKPKTISIVISVYNEEKALHEFYREATPVFEALPWNYELIFVNDGSADASGQILAELAAADPRVRVINFSRNFGHEAAMLAGLDHSSGEGIVCMDADLQHPPEVLVSMYRLWEQGYEVVEGVKRSRGKESTIHRACAGLFYKMMSKAVKIDMSRASDFKLLDRKAVDALLEMPEKNAFFRALSSWIGYRSTSVEFDVQERTEGESKWSTWSLIKYAVTNVVAFSTAPMQFVTVAGIFTFLFAIVLGIESLVRYFTGHAVEGFTTVILLILIVGSLIMMSLGIIGYYISKIYEEVKGRPKYLISKRAGKRK